MCVCGVAANTLSSPNTYPQQTWMANKYQKNPNIVSNTLRDGKVFKVCSTKSIAHPPIFYSFSVSVVWLEHWKKDFVEDIGKRNTKKTKLWIHFKLLLDCFVSNRNKLVMMTLLHERPSILDDMLFAVFNSYFEKTWPSTEFFLFRENKNSHKNFFKRQKNLYSNIRNNRIVLNRISLIPLFSSLTNKNTQASVSFHDVLTLFKRILISSSSSLATGRSVLSPVCKVTTLQFLVTIPVDPHIQPEVKRKKLQGKS